MKSKKIPKSLQPVLWSTDVRKLDLKKDAYYIIHQILAYGNFDDLVWLFKNYSKKEIIEIFKKSFKDYRRPRFYFAKNILLGLKNWQVDERYYVKNTPRIIR